MKNILLIIVIFASNGLFAQDFGKSNYTVVYPTYKSLDSKKAKKGTYKVEVLSETAQRFLVTSDMLLLIEEKRKTSESTYLEVSDSVRILILSKEAISNPNFNN